MNELLSIIVPVYNVEAYIEKCVESLINQTYNNLQIILIDDGSTDSSGHLCDMLATRDKRIQVFHQENGGQSRARNKGLQEATGQFITFVDSDDYVSTNMYEMMLNEAKRQNAEVVRCGMRLVTENDQIPDEKGECTSRNLNFEQMIEELEEHKSKLVVWNAIYKKELIEDIRFVEEVIYEDVFFAYQVLLRPHKEVMMDIPFYRYLILRQGSTNTTNFVAKKRLPVLNEFNRIRKDLKSINVREKTLHKFNIYCLGFGMDMYQLAYGQSDKSTMEQIIQFYRKIYEETDFSFSSHILSRNQLRCFYCFPNCLCKVKKMKQRLKRHLRR